jgi:hypothetical protein
MQKANRTGDPRLAEHSNTIVSRYGDCLINAVIGSISYDTAGGTETRGY